MKRGMKHQNASYLFAVNVQKLKLRRDIILRLCHKPYTGIDHTILIQEMNASIWPYIYMSSSFVPEISSTFIITYFYFILLLLLDSFCERIVVVS